MAEENVTDIAEQPSLPIESVEPSAPVEKEPKEPKEPKAEKPLSTRDAIKAAFKEETEKAERARDEKGKFAKEPKAAPEKAEKPKAAAKPEISATEPVPTPEPSKQLDAPKAWPKDKQNLWSGLTQEAREFILSREEQTSKGFQQYENLAPVRQTLERHTPYFQQMGVHPSQYIENAISWDRAFRDPQTRDKAFQEFAASYGINPLNMAPSEPQSIPPQLQPIIQQFPQITQEINQLRSQVSGFQNERLSSEIQAFAKDHPHFEKVRQTMGRLMTPITDTQGNITIPAAAQTLDEAYQKAIWLDDSIRKEMVNSELEAKSKEAVERAKNAHKAAVSVPSRAPVGASNGLDKGKPKSVRASIVAAIEEQREKSLT